MDGIDPGLVALLKANGMDKGYQWNNPLFWLIILGFLRGGGGGIFGGDAAVGATQAKLDCLQQGQQDAAMAAHNTNMVNLAHDNQVVTQNGFNRIAGQLAECCCNLSAGQKDIVNEICKQTGLLTTAMTMNTQRIVDVVNVHAERETQSKLTDCKAALSNANQTKELLSELREFCSNNDGHGHRSGGGK